MPLNKTKNKNKKKKQQRINLNSNKLLPCLKSALVFYSAGSSKYLIPKTESSNIWHLKGLRALTKLRQSELC